MLSALRRELIANELQQGGLASVRDLALRLDVSEVTIRRDLRQLDLVGEPVRVHGGAMPKRHSKCATSLTRSTEPCSATPDGLRA